MKLGVLIVEGIVCLIPLNSCHVSVSFFTNTVCIIWHYVQYFAASIREIVTNIKS